MGTSTNTSGSNQSNLQFNPIAQGVYNNLVQGGGNVLGGYMNNPFGNAFYQMGAGQSQKGAQQAGANNMAALNQNQLAQGLGGQAGQGYLSALRSQTGRANQSMMSQANISNVLAALQRQMTAAGTGLSFSPQLTGQTGSFKQQQTTGGLGTWLPQVAGGLLGAGMGAMTGGLSSALGGAMGGGGGGASAAMSTPFAGGMGMPSSAFSGFPSSIMSGAGGQMPSLMNPLNPFGSALMSQGFGG